MPTSTSTVAGHQPFRRIEGRRRRWACGAITSPSVVSRDVANEFGDRKIMPPSAVLAYLAIDARVGDSGDPISSAVTSQGPMAPVRSKLLAHVEFAAQPIADRAFVEQV